MTDYVRQTSSSDCETDDIITASLLNDEYDYLYGTVLDGGITADQLEADCVTADAIAANAVVTAGIKDANVTNAKLGADAVTAAKLADDAVVTANIDTSGAFSIFGSWTTTNSLGAALAKDPDDDSVYYLATSDMQVSAASSGVVYPFIHAYTDSSAPPTTVVHVGHNYHGSTVGDKATIAVCFPVKEGEYWKVRCNGTAAIRFIALGTGTCVAQ